MRWWESSLGKKRCLQKKKGLHLPSNPRCGPSAHSTVDLDARMVVCAQSDTHADGIVDLQGGQAASWATNSWMTKRAPGTWRVLPLALTGGPQGRAVTSPVEGRGGPISCHPPTTTPSRRHSQRNHQPPPHLAVHPSRKASDDNARLTRQKPRLFLIVARPPRHAIHPLYFIALPKFL